MEKQIYYAGFEIRSNEPIDEKLYIETLSVGELQRIYGVTGEWGFAKAVVFNRATGRWIKLNTFATQSDCINTANWSNVGEGGVEFVEWSALLAYNVGSCIWFEDSLNYVSFYIGLEPISAGENPENTPSKWYDLQSASIASTLYYQVLHRLDPDDDLTKTSILSVPAQVSNNGVNYPHVEIWGDFGERVSANIEWERVSCETSTYVEGGVMKVKFNLSGDLSDIEFNALDPLQTNIMIIIK